MSSDGLLTAPGLTNRAKKDDSDGPGAPLLGSGSGAAIESVVAASGTGWREVDATTVQEVCLLWALAWPLFFQTLANEIQLVITTALYGHLGETDLAAANDTTSMVWFVLVFVMGAQNALYTMAPQAVGAGSRRQVGVVLQVTLFWTVVVLGPLPQRPDRRPMIHNRRRRREPRRSDGSGRPLRRPEVCLRPRKLPVEHVDRCDDLWLGQLVALRVHLAPRLRKQRQRNVGVRAGEAG